MLWLLGSNACASSSVQPRSPCGDEVSNSYRQFTPCPASKPDVVLGAGKIPADQGALFGNIKVTDRTKTITEECRVVFTDEKGIEKAQVSLDETGWVFARVKLGTTSLAKVACGTAHLDPKISFDVLGGGKIVYFGHVLVELASFRVDWSNVATGALLGGGAVGGIIAGVAAAEHPTHQEPVPTGVTLTDLFDEAKREHEARHGKDGPLLEPYDAAAFANSRLLPGQRGSLGAPPGAVPFVFGMAKWQAAAACKDDGRKWSEDNSDPRCSGTTSAGIPGALSHLEFASGKLSAVDLVIGTPEDAEGWSKTFRDTQADLVRHYGKPVERRFVVPDECKATEQFLGCVASGKVTGSASWSLDDGRSVAMSIDGASSTIHVRLTAPPPKPTKP